MYITGDTHGDVDFQKLNSESFKALEGDYVIVCGDFACCWDGGEYDDYIQKWYSEKPWTTLFIDGNHENHDLLYSYPVEIWNGGKVHRINDSIIHLMRGQVFTIEGKKFFTMGGAASTDKVYREEGVSWWAGEMPSREEYEEAIDNLSKHDFKVDYVITHCAPEELLGIERDYNELTRFLGSLISDYKLEFNDWFCGHYHTNRYLTPVKILYNRIVNLDADISRMKVDAIYTSLFEAQSNRQRVRIVDDMGNIHEGIAKSIQKHNDIVLLDSIYNEPISVLNIVNVSRCFEAAKED